MDIRRLRILPLVAGALVLIACEVEEEPIEEEPIAEEIQPQPAPAPEPMAQPAGVPVSQIVESPATWTGQTVAGEVRVTEVVSDRGFWIEDQGERLFVVIQPETTERPNIQQGMSVRLREAVVRDPTFITNLGQLDPEAQNTLQGLPVFLTVDPQNIEMVGHAP